MHQNPAFRKTDNTTNLEFMRQRGFGVLVSAGGDHPLVSHVPFVLSADGSHADLHLMRSNPIARNAPLNATLAVSGPDSYVSPNWSGVPDQVPTWNYVAVHALGRLDPLPQEELRPLLDRQSAHFEDQLTPKKSWHMDKMTPDVADRMMRQIRPFRLEITHIESTWKLGQNKPDAARDAAAAEVETTGIGQDIQMLSWLMANLPSRMD